MEKFPKTRVNTTESSESHIPQETRSQRKKFSYLGATLAAFTTVFALSVGVNAHKFYEQEEQRVSQENRDKYESNKNLIRDKLGQTTLFSLGADAYTAERTQSWRVSDFTISGFEGYEGVSNGDVETLVEEQNGFLPQEWVRGRVSRIEYEPKDLPIAEGYSAKAGYRTGLIQVFRENSQEGYVNRTPETDRYRGLSLMLQTLRHETCHANDWRSTFPYSFEDRVALLANVITRVESADAYDADQVLVSGEDGTAEPMPYHQLTGDPHTAYLEYFADICEAYFTDPKALERDFPKDYDIVDILIEKRDPGFKERMRAGGPFSPQTGEILQEWKELFDKK